MKNLWKNDSTHDRIAIIIWDYDTIDYGTIWLSVIPRVWCLWLIEFAGLMTLFYFDLQSSITHHSLFLDRILADILSFNISNLRRCFFNIFFDRFDQVVTLDIWIFKRIHQELILKLSHPLWFLFYKFESWTFLFKIILLYSDD